MSRKAGSKQRNDEMTSDCFSKSPSSCPWFLEPAFVLLLFAMNNRENQEPAVENSGSRFISPDHPRQLVDFALTDRTGRTVTRSELDGKFLVVDFLFTSCSLTCPVVNSTWRKSSN